MFLPDRAVADRRLLWRQIRQPRGRQARGVGRPTLAKNDIAFVADAVPVELWLTRLRYP
jgi:hypothetical protein